jgi:hypothetical protein
MIIQGLRHELGETYKICLDKKLSPNLSRSHVEI